MAKRLFIGATSERRGAARRGRLFDSVRWRRGLSNPAHRAKRNMPMTRQKLAAGAITAEDADLIVDLVETRPVKMKLVLTPQTCRRLKAQRDR